MASNYLSPLNTKLDAAQVIRKAYDEPNNRIRVDAQVSATIGSVDVIIDAATGDNIKVSDGTNSLLVNPDGSINVNTTGSSSNNNVHDGFGNPITSTNNSLQNTQSLHTLTPDAVSSLATFNGVNTFAILDVTGLATIGFQLNPGTFTGRLQAQSSIDGGNNWVNINFYDPGNAAVLPYLDYVSPNSLSIVSIVPIGGSSHIRVVSTNHIGGSATGFIRASNVVGASGSITASAFGNVSNVYISIPSNTPTLILSANPNRKYAYISNNSGSTLNIQFGSSTGLTAQKGLVVKSQDFYQLQGTNLYTGNIYGFSATNITISVAEGTP